jgi:hypothetical protein
MKYDSNTEKKISNLGIAGEKIVVNRLVQQGFKPQHHVNEYDSTGDITIDGRKVEVKTQTPFVKKNAFTIPAKQKRKCLEEASVLYFVSVPNSYTPHFSEGKVYRIDNPQSVKYEIYRPKANDGDRICIPINQEGVVEDFTLNEDEKRLLVRNSTSSYNGYSRG